MVKNAVGGSLWNERASEMSPSLKRVHGRRWKRAALSGTRAAYKNPRPSTLLL